jgi:hypothetical protein
MDRMPRLGAPEVALPRWHVEEIFGSPLARVDSRARWASDIAIHVVFGGDEQVNVDCSANRLSGQPGICRPVDTKKEPTLSWRQASFKAQVRRGKRLRADRLSNVDNETSRRLWVTEQLVRAGRAHPGGTVLDVGAGERPYASSCRDLGLVYRSHDFTQYDGIGDEQGLQCGSWTTSGHDVVCDILSIPLEWRSDIVLCTEVLEHVPDPVRALERLTLLAKPQGTIIITVPFLSLMHQAPFWFQSGLSHYWFEYWAGQFEVNIEELVISGDYVDLVQQEAARMASGFAPVSRLWRLASPWFGKAARGRAPESLLSCGGFGTFFVGRMG